MSLLSYIATLQATTNSNSMTTTSKGSLYITISAFFYASYGLWSRLMNHSFGEFNQAWTRAIIVLALLIPYLAFSKQYQSIKKADWKWFVIIGLVGGLNQAPYYYGFQNLPIGTAILIFYACLMLSGFILGKLVFKEVIDRTKQISFICALIGMGIIYRFSLNSSQIIPALAMAAAGFMGGTAGILPKKLSSNYSEPQIMLSYLFLMIVFNLPLSLYFQETLPEFKNVVAWLPQAGYAAAMLIANLTVIAGFKHLAASIGSLIGLTEIIFGALIGYAFFAEPLTVSTLIGGSLIILSAILPNLKR